MRIAVIAHDKLKDQLVEFVLHHMDFFSQHTLIATGTTGGRIIDATGLPVKRLKSGPLGGDQEIGSMVANQQIDMVFFFRDPLTAQPHEPDVSALLRLCDVYHIPLATNPVTASFFIKSVK